MWYRQVLPNAAESLLTLFIHFLINDAEVFTMQ